MLLCLFTSGAGNDADYVGLSTTVTFPAGSVDNDTQCLNVSITDDDIAVEGDETFNVTLTESDDGVMTGDSMQIITIMDDEGIL